MAKNKKKKWNESDVFEMLRHVWPSPAHVRLPQVRNGTGFSRKSTRTADAMIASTWPSRGLWLAGVEIKVSVSDWKKELSQPEKSDEIGKYCDYWYAAAPAGVIPIEQVPETWGLIEVKGNTSKIVKSAPRRENAAPIDILLLCSILRTAESSMVPLVEANRRVAEAIERDHAANIKAGENDHKLRMLTEYVSVFEEHSGVNIKDTWEGGKIGDAVKVIMDAGCPNRALKELKHRSSILTETAKRIEEVIQNGENNESA